MAHWMEGDIEGLLGGVGGVDVVHGGESGKGVIDEIDQDVLAGLDTKMLSDHTQVTVRSLAFPTLKIGDSITVGGTTYKVIDQKKAEDGALTRLLVRIPS